MQVEVEQGPCTIPPCQRGVLGPPFRAVVFDLDGTLLDTEALSDEAMLRALEAAGFNVVPASDTFPRLLPWALKRQILGRRGSEFGPIVVDYAQREWSGGCMTADTLWAEWGQQLDTLLESPGADLCDGAGALISSLAHAGVAMGINTSSKSVAVAHKRKRHEQTLFRHMQCVVTGDDVSRGKPLPDSFFEAARRLQVPPQLCVAFEDSLPGVQSAAAAGMRVYSIPDARLDDTELAEFRRLSHRTLASLRDLQEDADFLALFK